MFCGLAPRAAWHDALIGQYRPLLEADALIRENYVTTTTDSRLVQGALRGVMGELDPYSSYLSPQQWQAYQDRLAGHLVGIGLEVGIVHGEPTVIAPLADSPSDRAGIRAGDRLISLDRTSAKNLGVFAINALLAGPQGSAVAIILARGPNDEVLRFEIKREPFASDSVRGHSRGENGWQWLIDKEQAIAYIRITDFGKSMVDQFDAALTSCKGQNVRGLLIDLRNNPGGLVPQAIHLIDRFVDPQDLPLLTIQSRQGARTIYNATPENTDSDIILAVLINRYSASAAEIVAGSLQDHQRATIVGEQSFGKGSVQYFSELESGGVIRLTSAYYRLPKGRIVHRMLQEKNGAQWGVIPDILVTEEDGQASPPEPEPAQSPQSLGRDAPLEAALRSLREKLANKPDPT